MSTRSTYSEYGAARGPHRSSSSSVHCTAGAAVAAVRCIDALVALVHHYPHVSGEESTIVRSLTAETAPQSIAAEVTAAVGGGGGPLCLCERLGAAADGLLTLLCPTLQETVVSLGSLCEGSRQLQLKLGC